MVLALPVLRLLKLAHPQAEIYWWISSEISSLLEHDPDLSGLFVFHRKKAASPFFWPEVIKEIFRMRAMKFTHVLDLQSLARSGVTAWLANGGVTIGLDDLREGASTFYDVILPRQATGVHAGDWYLSTLSYFGVKPHTNFTWLPVNQDAVNRMNGRSLAADRIILNPGAKWVNKRWPTEHFAALARMLRKQFPTSQLVLLGGRGDRAICDQIRLGCTEVLDLAGETSIPDLVEVIRGARFMITNDTGPMHIAAALKTPVRALFGPTDPRWTGPYGQMENVLQLNLPCVPCMKPGCHNPIYLECLKALDPSRVAATLQHS